MSDSLAEYWKINECQVCNKEIKKDEKIKDTHCSHTYHEICYNKMIEDGAKVCLTCKRELPNLFSIENKEKESVSLVKNKEKAIQI